MATTNLSSSNGAVTKRSPDRRFELAVDNYAAVVLVPPLVAAVSAAAPAVLDVRRMHYKHAFAGPMFPLSLPG